MDSDHKQYLAFALVIVGLCATALGGWKGLEALTTASVGVVGAGLGLLKGSSDNNSLKASGDISVTAPSA